MASSLWFCIFMIIHMVYSNANSLQNPCSPNVLQSTCSADPFNCIWSQSTSSCICNTDSNINIIYIIDITTSTKLDLHTITSSIETISTKTITFQQKQTTENTDFETAIDHAITSFSSYNTNYGQIRNILIIFDQVLTPFIQNKLQTNDIQTITVSSNDAHILSSISCAIQSYQHHLSLLRQQRVLLQSNTAATCCQCLTITKTVGCSVDNECEDIVCSTDHICCKESIDVLDPAIGWDETCVTMAHRICNQNRLTIHNPIAIASSDIGTREYNACWEIQSNTVCNEYGVQFGCIWSILDEECMCRMDIGVNVIYLVDISLDSMPSNTDYQDIISIIEDVMSSTVHSVIILYDENVYIDANDISQIERTERTNILNAIDTALNQFILFNNDNKRVLVIFNGDIQDPAIVCSKRNELDKNRVSVIVNAYTIYEETYLECLVNNAAYNDIDIHSGYPIKAKLSWDLCQSASNPIFNPTPNPTVSSQSPIVIAAPTRYIYKQAPISRVFPCLEPRELCNDAQLFDETQCACQCIEARPSICPDLMIYNVKTCKCQVYSLLVSSRLEELNAECVYNGDVDVLFVVDSSCGIESASCDNIRELIANMVEVIKISDNHRVGLLECAETFGSQYKIHILDKYFNEINNDLSFDRMDVFDLYFNAIKSELQCLSGSVVPKRECLEDAVRIISDDVDVDVDRDRMRKIVYIELCGVSEGEDPCSIDTQWIESIGDDIEIILVNIGDIKEYENECLLRNGRENVYKFDGFDFNLEHNMEIRNRLIEDICSSTHEAISIDIDTLDTLDNGVGEILNDIDIDEVDLGVVSNLDIEDNDNHDIIDIEDNGNDIIIINDKADTNHDDIIDIEDNINIINDHDDIIETNDSQNVESKQIERVRNGKRSQNDDRGSNRVRINQRNSNFVFGSGSDSDSDSSG